MRILLSALLTATTLAEAAAALDVVKLRRQEQVSVVEGRILETAEDGGLLVEARDGVLWRIEPAELVEKARDGRPFQPLSAEQLGERVLAGLPKGFEVYRTSHYLICYDTSRAYAQWCGSLLERLYMAFTNFWTRKGFELAEPRWPLVAIVFADARSYARHARPEVGDGAGSIIAYFNLETNRVTMYDLTGSEASGRAAERGPAALLTRILALPDAERTVATIVHEATHQIAFNCGLHTRLSDCPTWFSEGIATYFETPDLTSFKGWRNIGGINRPRLTRFQESRGRRGPDLLRTLLGDDRRLRDPKQALDAYAESWALTYYLLRQQPRQYVAYLKTLSRKRALVWDDPETRLKEFQEAFGDLNRLEADFLRFMDRLR